jgi:alkanesulfonate monooxygenase SsuD/methylene tetrahydromethanopterin reductase-like flavin-dependent oxidoreductase (luciferase family)
VRILPAMYCVVGETKTIAEEKIAYIERLFHPMDALALLSEVLNFDFATKDLDEPFSDDEMASISGLQALRDRVVRLSGKANPTTRDFVDVSGRGTVRDHPRFVGTVKEVADGLEEWFVTEACDGFVLAATHVPGAYEDFVRLVVPELQRRGVYQREYAGTTLRENLGLPRAERGDWAPRRST